MKVTTGTTVYVPAFVGADDEPLMVHDVVTASPACRPITCTVNVGVASPYVMDALLMESDIEMRSAESVSAASVYAPLPSVSLTVKLAVVGAVGVPAMVPSDASASPVGNDPDTSDHVALPLAVPASDVEYATPSGASGNVDVVIEGAPAIASSVTVNVVLAVADPTVAVTVTV